MTNMFKPKMPAAPPPLPEPRPTRLPSDIDPVVQDAAKRTRASAMRRSGRRSTILTQGLGDDTNVVGSGGKYLGG